MKLLILSRERNAEDIIIA